jgi:hypothetical protein
LGRQSAEADEDQDGSGSEKHLQACPERAAELGREFNCLADDRFGPQLFCARNMPVELPPRLALLMREQNSLEADQSSHPLFCAARADVFGHERAIKFTPNA